MGKTGLRLLALFCAAFVLTLTTCASVEEWWNLSEGDPAVITAERAARQAEEDRLAEESRQAEEARVAEAARQAEEARRAEAAARQQGPVSFYIVRRGDTLWSIAADPRVYNDSSQWPRLFITNRRRLRDPNNPNLIEPGQVLEVPRPGDSRLPDANRD